MVTESNDRGQVILIGAITLAFIILGIVIVFNGVLFTETISAGDTSQSAATADKIELEVTHGVACSMANAEGNSSAEDNVETFADRYQHITAESDSAVIDISHENINVGENNWSVDVDISYDSADLSYEQTREITHDQTQDITNEQCPGEQQ